MSNPVERFADARQVEHLEGLLRKHRVQLLNDLTGRRQGLIRPERKLMCDTLTFCEELVAWAAGTLTQPTTVTATEAAELAALMDHTDPTVEGA